MKKTLLVASGGVIGYVMGARAGRERYESLREGSKSLVSTSNSLIRKQFPNALPGSKSDRTIDLEDTTWAESDIPRAESNIFAP